MVFEARNEIGHVVLATTNSLAFDTYADKNLGESGDLSQIFCGLYNILEDDSDGFSSKKLWYQKTQDEDSEGNTSINATFKDAIEARFVAYLTDGGTTEDAEAILERYHVVGGLEGLDFSESSVEDGDLTVKVKYKIEYEFRVFGMKPLELEQSACSKLWE